MRLYLSSFRLGDHPDVLTRIAPPPGPVAVVANACDDRDATTRLADVVRETDALSTLGYDACDLDLRQFFGGPDALATALVAVRMLWVRGGNVFLLNHALRESGADRLIRDRLRRDQLVYAGYSAGPCVLAPSLAGLELCDDASAVHRIWGVRATTDGLGVLDHAIVPHVDTPTHPESATLEEVGRRYVAAGVAHRQLRDGDVLVVEGQRTTLLPRRSTGSDPTGH